MRNSGATSMTAGVVVRRDTWVGDGVVSLSLRTMGRRTLGYGPNRYLTSNQEGANERN